MQTEYYLKLLDNNLKPFKNTTQIITIFPKSFIP